MRKWWILALFLAVCGWVPTAWAQGRTIHLTWTAGGVGGGWYGMAGGFAEIIHEAEPDIIIKVVPGGGTKNPPLIASKAVEIGWGLPFVNAAAYRGLPPYDRPMTELRALAGGMSMNFFHFFVAADSPIRTMDEVFGQKKKLRIAVSPAGTSDEWVFRKVLEYYKTNYKDLEKAGFVFSRGNYAHQANQFKDGNVDAVFTFLALPGAAVTEASVGRKLRLIDFPEDLLDYLGQFGILPGKIPVGTYPKAANTRDVVTARSGSVITVHKDMPEDLAYRITRAINENLDKVHKIHASLKPYRVVDGPTGCGVPLHPGAERYYREKGVLK